MRWFSEAKGQHPWLNTRCREAIAKKHAAEGSVDYIAARDFCFDVLYDEYRKHIARTKLLLQDCVRGSRKWWKLNAVLLNRSPKSSSIPALRDGPDEWLFEPEQKANLFAVIWDMKKTLPPATRPEPTWQPPEGNLLDRIC